MLDLSASPRPLSEDYLRTKQQFHLHALLTEQRHPKTWNLSQVLARDTREGLAQLMDVDLDITEKIERITQDQRDGLGILALLEKAAKNIAEAFMSPEDRKVYIYGCGSTGRLAKQIESETWKQYWRRIRERHAGTPLWEKVSKLVGENIADKVIGELTGGDRALVNALEGFEDLQVIG